MGITRRKALQMGLMGGGALLLPIAFDNKARSAVLPWISPPMTPFQRNFVVPATLAPVRSDNIAGTYGPTQTYTGTDYYSITMQKATAQILPAPAPATQFWTYNGTTPGPLIKQRIGRRSIVRFINSLGNDSGGLPISTSIHLHGMPSLPQFDGWANDLTPPNYYKNYIYPNSRAATMWYHDHAVHNTSRNVYMGLAGMYLGQDTFELGLAIPQGAFDIPLILTDKVLNANGSIFFDPNAIDGFWGDIILVNGVPWPKMTVQRRKYRFRVLSAGPSRAYNLSLSNGAPITVIGSDGGLLAAPVQTPNLVTGVAERYEIVIDFSQYPDGTQIILNNGPLNNHKDFPQTNVIMRFDVTGTAPIVEPPLPTALRPITPINPGSAVATREFVFEKQGGLWKINGLTWDPARSDANPPLNGVEVWRLRNNGGGWNHPIHIHLIDFQLVSRTNGVIKNYEQGLKDVVFLGENQVIEVVARYGPHNGKYMFHCHNVVHEDHDMMTNFQVGVGGPDPVTSAPALPLPAPPL